MERRPNLRDVYVDGHSPRARPASPRLLEHYREQAEEQWERRQAERAGEESRS